MNKQGITAFLLVLGGCKTASHKTKVEAPLPPVLSQLAETAPMQKPDAPNFTIGTSQLGNNQVSVLVMEAKEKVDYYEYTLVPSGQAPDLPVSTTSDTVVLYNESTGSYDIGVRACQRSRVDLSQTICSEESPTKSFTLVNTLSQDQISQLKNIDAVKEANHLITRAAHLQILSILKTLSYPDVQSDTDLQNAFATALIGPDALSSIMNNPQYVGLAMAIAEANGGRCIGLCAQPGSGINPAAPLVMVTLGGLGLLTSIVAFVIYQKMQETKVNIEKNFDSFFFAGAKEILGRGAVKAANGSKVDLISDQLLPKKIHVQETAWNAMLSAPKLEPSDAATKLDAAFAVSNSDDKIKFLRVLLNGVQIPDPDHPGKWMDVSPSLYADASELSYRNKVKFGIQEALKAPLENLKFDEGVAEVDAKDSTMAAYLRIARLQVNFLQYDMARLAKDNQDLIEKFQNNEEKLAWENRLQQNLKILREREKANDPLVAETWQEFYERMLEKAAEYKLPTDAIAMRYKGYFVIECERMISIYEAQLLTNPAKESEIRPKLVQEQQWIKNADAIFKRAGWFRGGIGVLEALGPKMKTGAYSPEEEGLFDRVWGQAENSVVSILKREQEENKAAIAALKKSNDEIVKKIQELSSAKDDIDIQEISNKYKIYNKNIQDLVDRASIVQTAFFDAADLAEVGKRVDHWIQGTLPALLMSVKDAGKTTADVLNDALRSFANTQATFSDAYGAEVGIGGGTLASSLKTVFNTLRTQALIPDDVAFATNVRTAVERLANSPLSALAKVYQFDSLTKNVSRQQKLNDVAQFAEKTSKASDRSIAIGKWGSAGGAIASLIILGAGAGIAQQKAALASQGQSKTGDGLRDDMNSGVLYYLNMQALNNVLAMHLLGYSTPLPSNL